MYGGDGKAAASGLMRWCMSLDDADSAGAREVEQDCMDAARRSLDEVGRRE